jgi:hypothetical protein
MKPMVDKIGLLLHSIYAGSTMVTFLETANQIIDLIAGLLAVTVGVLTVIWWLRRLNKKESDESA